MLRDPVDRAHSNWAHLWSAGLEPEPDFLAACAAEPGRRAAGWAHFWHYLTQGRYGEQLQHLLDVFPREQVLVLRYRDLRERPQWALDTVCGFLGVRTGLLTGVPRENVTSFVPHTPVNSALRAALRLGGEVGHRFPEPPFRRRSRPAGEPHRQLVRRLGRDPPCRRAGLTGQTEDLTDGTECTCPP
jgi:hypothetical protein